MTGFPNRCSSARIAASILGDVLLEREARIGAVDVDDGEPRLDPALVGVALQHRDAALVQAAGDALRIVQAGARAHDAFELAEGRDIGVEGTVHDPGEVAPAIGVESGSGPQAMNCRVSGGASPKRRRIGSSSSSV